MAKTNIKNLDKVLERVKNALTEIDDSTYQEIGDYVLKRVVSKARMGKTMISGDDAKLKPLSKNYIEAREAMIARDGANLKGGSAIQKRIKGSINSGAGSALAKQMAAAEAGLDTEFFSPKRSNLTLTGQYLRSFAITKIDKLKRIMFIEPTGNREGETLSNKKLAEYLAEQGRSIFGLDKLGRKAIREKVLRALRSKLRSTLLKK